jgi:hypothetical protein
MPLSYYYLVFELARMWRNGEAPTLESLNEKLAEKGLPVLLEKEFVALVKTFDPPLDFDFEARNHEPTLRYLEHRRVLPLCPPIVDDDILRVQHELLPHVPTDEAGEVRLDPFALDVPFGAIRERLHLLITGHTSRTTIAAGLNAMFRIDPPITERMVAIYRFFFWNTDVVVGEGELAEILRDHYDRDRLLRAWRYGYRHAAYLAGLKPALREPTEPLKEAYSHVLWELENLRGDHGPGVMADRERLSKLALALFDKLYPAHNEALMQATAEVRQFIMKHSDTKIPWIEDVIDRSKGGSYSGDGSYEPRCRASAGGTSDGEGRS